MKIEAEIWKMENGKIRQVKIEGNIYSIVERRGTKKPKKGIYYSETYKTWLREDDLLTVKRAINKFGESSDFKSIKKRTGLSEGRIYTALEYLKKQNKLKKDQNGQYYIV